MVKIGSRVLEFGALITVATGAGMLYVKVCASVPARCVVNKSCLHEDSYNRSIRVPH